MKATEIIERIKRFHKGTVNGKPIEEQTTRDQVLYGNPDQECTGIVTTCQASIGVIQKAIELGANLIIVHESLFWNHGDHTEWLEKDQNKTFMTKKKLLDEHEMIVWRDHDYIHSGIPEEREDRDGFIDGIFYGIVWKLEWTQYLVDDDRWQIAVDIPPMSVKELSKYISKKFNLEGVRVIGNTDTPVSRVRVAFHVFGDAKEYIRMADQGEADCILTMELVDYTLAEYLRDSSFTAEPKAAICMGHFNIEEPGMNYLAKRINDLLNGQLSCTFVQSGDMYHYVV